ncbi:hypothetical protein U9M48_025898 [Paspalum notatum var. saurae]|uniref:Uncharacterized protein n=1 Tax=Paspalum notatum var. saurae TaxID=547442 RepID=A0AAQ3TW22_PASNO
MDDWLFVTRNIYLGPSNNCSAFSRHDDMIDTWIKPSIHSSSSRRRSSKFSTLAYSSQFNSLVRSIEQQQCFNSLVHPGQQIRHDLEHAGRRRWVLHGVVRRAAAGKGAEQGAHVLRPVQVEHRLARLQPHGAGEHGGARGEQLHAPGAAFAAAPGDRRRQGLEHALVGLAVAHAQHQVRRRVPAPAPAEAPPRHGGQQGLHRRALGRHALRVHLHDVPAAAAHRGGLVRQHGRQVVVQILGLARAQHRVRLLVVPRQRPLLLLLHVRPVGRLGEVVSVLRREAELLARRKPRFQLILAAAADEEDDVLGVGAQLVQDPEHLVAGRPLALVHQLRHQGPVVVEQDQAARRRAVRLADELRRERREARLDPDGAVAHPEPEPREPHVREAPAGGPQRGVERLRPGDGVVRAQEAVVAAVPGLLLLRAHGDGGAHGVGDAVQVPRVHADRAAQRRRAPGELRQHDGAALPRAGELLAAHRVEVGDPVEPVAEGAHHAAVGGGVVGHLLAQRHGPVDEDHGAREPLVDAVPDPLRLVGDGVGVAAAAARRVVDLHQHHLAAQVPVLLQHPLQGQQLEAHALGAVDVVDADQERAAAVRVGDLLGLGGGLRRRQRGPDPAHVEADGEDLDQDGAAVVVDAHVAAAAGDHAQEARAAGEEVARVVEGVEADEVRAEEAPEEVVADGDGAEDLAGGEGRVEEEADAGARALAAQEGGQHPEVVVVDDDEVAVVRVRGEHLEHAVREPPVGGEERPVLTGVEAQIGGGVARRVRQQVVQPRPEVALAEAVVEVGVEVGVEVNGEAREVAEEVVVELVGGRNGGSDGGRQGADERDVRGGEAARELERERVGVQGEGEAERRGWVRRRAEREPVGRHDAARASGDGRRRLWLRGGVSGSGTRGARASLHGRSGGGETRWRRGGGVGMPVGCLCLCARSGTSVVG